MRGHLLGVQTAFQQSSHMDLPQRKRQEPEYSLVLTTPVLLSGNMNDLITPPLPATGGRLGWKGGGRSTALLFDLSTIFPFTSRLRCCFEAEVPSVFKSTPLVSALAAQFKFQLCRKRRVQSYYGIQTFWERTHNDALSVNGGPV